MSESLTNEQRAIFNSKKVSFELTLYEIQIIKAMREVKFGQFTVHLTNGVPLRYVTGASVAIDPREVDLDD